MALYLVQHGISAAKDIDPERGLTDRGRAETERIAEVAGGYGIRVGRIVHSGKKRAAQTASIYHDVLSLKTPLEAVPGLNPLDDVRVFAERITADANLMVVGHMPFMQRLVSYLVTGSAEMRIYQFQNSGIVCLDADEEADGKRDWFIRWTLNPNIS
jgi:phosphohistidine phosphatase